MWSINAFTGGGVKEQEVAVRVNCEWRGIYLKSGAFVKRLLTAMP
jgi:hypothetical protein